MAKRTISLLNIKILADAAGVTKGTKKAKNALKGFGTSGKKSLGGVSASMIKLAGVVAGVAAGLAIAAKVIKLIAKNTIEVANALEKTTIKAATLGTTVQDLTALRSEAARAGSSVETLDTALQRLVRRVSEAAKGTGEAVGALKELGLNAKELAKRDIGAVFETVAVALSRVENQGDRVRLMMKLVDTEGVALDATFRLIAKGGMQAAVDRAREFSLVLSSIDESNLQRTVEASNELRDAWQGVKNQLAAAFAPFVTNLITAAAAAMKRLLDNIRLARIVLLRLGGTSAAAARAIVEAADKSRTGLERSLGAIPGLADVAADHLKAMAETAADAFAGPDIAKAIERLKGRLKAIVDPVLTVAAGPVAAIEAGSQAGLSAINASARETRRAEIELRKFEMDRKRRDERRDVILREMFEVMSEAASREPLRVTSMAIVG